MTRDAAISTYNHKLVERGAETCTHTTYYSGFKSRKDIGYSTLLTLISSIEWILGLAVQTDGHVAVCSNVKNDAWRVA